MSSVWAGHEVVSQEVCSYDVLKNILRVLFCHDRVLYIVLNIEYKKLYM